MENEQNRKIKDIILPNALEVWVFYQITGL